MDQTIKCMLNTYVNFKRKENKSKWQHLVHLVLLNTHSQAEELGLGNLSGMYHHGVVIQQL